MRVGPPLARLSLCALVLAACTDSGRFPVGTLTGQFRSRLDVGDQLVRDGQLQEAQTVFREIAISSSTPNQKVEAFQRLGDTYLRSDNTQLAEATFRELLLIEPDNSRAMTGLGIALNLEGHPAEAELVLRQAVQLGEPAAYSPLGVSLDAQNRYAEAQHIYLEGLERRIRARELDANLAISYALSGNSVEAISTIKRVTSLLLVPDRYKRNHVFILALIDQEGAAEITGQRLGLSIEDIRKSIEIAREIKVIPVSQRGAHLLGSAV